MEKPNLKWITETVILPGGKVKTITHCNTRKLYVSNKPESVKHWNLERYRKLARQWRKMIDSG